MNPKETILRKGKDTKTEDSSMGDTVEKQSDTLSEFSKRIDSAKMAGERWVETSPEIIRYFNPRGLGGAKYFTYSGILVCEFGKIEEAENQMDNETGRALFSRPRTSGAV